MKSKKIDKRVYYAQCEYKWDCDRWNEWKLGFSVYPNDVENEPPWNVYEDDGKGNGSFIENFESLEDAKRFCDAWCMHLDERIDF